MKSSPSKTTATSNNGVHKWAAFTRRPSPRSAWWEMGILIAAWRRFCGFACLHMIRDRGVLWPHYRISDAGLRATSLRCARSTNSVISNKSYQHYCFCYCTVRLCGPSVYSEPFWRRLATSRHLLIVGALFVTAQPCNIKVTRE